VNMGFHAHGKSPGARDGADFRSMHFAGSRNYSGSRRYPASIVPADASAPDIAGFG